MSLAVVFFVGAALAVLVVGFSFVRTKDRDVRSFGWGLVATGVAFGFWAIARIINSSDSDDLEVWITIGVLFLLVGLLLFLYAWAAQLERSLRDLVLVGGLVYLVVLVVVRFANPSEPFIDAGILFFNPHGSVAALEVGALTTAILPAIFGVSRRMRPRDARVADSAFTAFLVSGIVLVTSVDRLLITIASWVMVVVLVALLATFVVRQPARWLAQGHADSTD